MLGLSTGVARVVTGFRKHMITRQDPKIVDYAISLRGYKTVARQQRFPAPAGLLTRAWMRCNYPTLDTFFGKDAPRKADIVHGTNFVVPPTKHASRIITVHDVTPFVHPEWCTPASRRYTDIIRRAVVKGAHVHAVSQATADDLASHVAIDQDRIHVIYPGIDSPPVASSAIRTRPYLLALGTIEPRKNYVTLIRAFDQLATQFPDLELVIAGSEGWGIDSVRTAIQYAQAASRICLVGRVTEADRAALLHHAEALVYPSLLEGFGYPPLEAMQVSTPVIAADLPALREVCGTAAIFASPEDPESLASAIAGVLEDSIAREQLVVNAKNHVTKFQWPNATSALVDLYQRIAS